MERFFSSYYPSSPPPGGHIWGFHVFFFFGFLNAKDEGFVSFPPLSPSHQMPHGSHYRTCLIEQPPPPKITHIQHASSLSFLLSPSQNKIKIRPRLQASAPLACCHFLKMASYKLANTPMPAPASNPCAPPGTPRSTTTRLSPPTPLRTYTTQAKTALTTLKLTGS